MSLVPAASDMISLLPFSSVLLAYARHGGSTTSLGPRLDPYREIWPVDCPGEVRLCSVSVSVRYISQACQCHAVSYTHLTLPTNREV